MRTLSLLLASVFLAATAHADDSYSGSGVLVVGTRIVLIDVELDAPPEAGGEGLGYVAVMTHPLMFSGDGDSFSVEMSSSKGAPYVYLSGDCKLRKDSSVVCEGEAETDDWTRSFTLMLSGEDMSLTR